MKKQLIGLGTAALVLGGLISSAAATTMISTWTGTITGISKNNDLTTYDIGDTFTVINEYDDHGTEYHDYSDGANGIAEFGAGDDTVFRLHELTEYPNTSYLNDIQSGLPQEISDLITLATDNHFQNTSYENLIDGVYRTTTLADGLVLTMSYNPLATTPQHERLLIYNNNTIDTIIEFTTERTATPKNSNAVPEPTTLFLFGTGLVGLASSRFRKNNT